MQNTLPDASARDVVLYRERLAPSLWIFVTAALIGPMAGVVFVPVGSTVALLVGCVLSALVVTLLAISAPRIEVTAAQLRAGRAHVELRHLGSPVTLHGDEARHARGPGLDPRSWHLIRGGIDGLVVIPLEDPDDPVPSWVISSRTPDRLAAALRRPRSQTAS